MTTCPLCGDPSAYVGLLATECKNPECKNFAGPEPEPEDTLPEFTLPESFTFPWQ